MFSAKYFADEYNIFIHKKGENVRKLLKNPHYYFRHKIYLTNVSSYDIYI